jgi:hypothetical protein
MGDDPKVALDAIIKDLRGVSVTRGWDALEAIVNRLVALFKSLHPIYHISDALNCHVIAFIYTIPFRGDEAIDRTASEFQFRFNQMFDLGVSLNERYEDWSEALDEAAVQLNPGDWYFIDQVLTKMQENYNNGEPFDGDYVSSPDAVFMDIAHMQSISAFFVKLCKDMCTPGRSDRAVFRNTAEFGSLYTEMLRIGWTNEQLTSSVRQKVLGDLATVQMLMQSYIAANLTQEVAFRITFVQCIRGVALSWEKLCWNHREARPKNPA